MRGSMNKHFVAAVAVLASMSGMASAADHPVRPIPATGGEYIPVPSAEASADLNADRQFKSLFQTWKSLDGSTGLGRGAIAIPSVQPVAKLQFTTK